MLETFSYANPQNQLPPVVELFHSHIRDHAHDPTFPVLDPLVLDANQVTLMFMNWRRAKSHSSFDQTKARSQKSDQPLVQCDT